MTIDRIDLSKSKVGKDFGCGFYLSDNKEQAFELAQRKTEQVGTGVPTVNSFEFDEKVLDNKELSILIFNEYSPEWAEFILKNRQNKSHSPIHDYDIVIGPIANDRVGFQIRRFISGLIDKETFLKELKYMKGITIQYYFGTELAIGHLKRLEP